MTVLDGDWTRDAACQKPGSEGLDFFARSAEDRYAARAVCLSVCPVRWKCLQFALESQEIHGIWGGVDDYEIRRALSVDHLGQPARRARAPRCPYCVKSNLSTIEKKRARNRVRCDTCHLEWWIRRAPRAPKLVPVDP